VDDSIAGMAQLGVVQNVREQSGLAGRDGVQGCTLAAGHTGRAKAWLGILHTRGNGGSMAILHNGLGWPHVRSSKVRPWPRRRGCTRSSMAGVTRAVARSRARGSHLDGAAVEYCVPILVKRKQSGSWRHGLARGRGRRSGRGRHCMICLARRLVRSGTL